VKQREQKIIRFGYSFSTSLLKAGYAQATTSENNKLKKLMLRVTAPKVKPHLLQRSSALT